MPYAHVDWRRGFFSAGCAVGADVGDAGAEVGAVVGCVAGADVGAFGAADGCVVGAVVGAVIGVVGADVGSFGAADGCVVGSVVGAVVGCVSSSEPNNWRKNSSGGRGGSSDFSEGGVFSGPNTSFQSSYSAMWMMAAIASEDERGS